MKLSKKTSNSTKALYLTCEMCGVSVIRYPANLFRHVFCSRSCYGYYIKYKRPKENHPRLGTGLSDEERKFRIKARQKFSKAKRRKKNPIPRLPCMVCGLKAEAHHADYTKPLEVVWLCKIHHEQLHSLEHHKSKSNS